jgi:cell wall-associated NlpC family hydrolase
MIAQPERLLWALVVILTTALGAGCSSTPEVSGAPRAVTPMVHGSEHQASAGDRAASIALEQVGVPYRYGGSSPVGFDCSGLVQYAYSRAGVSVPRTTGQLWSAATTVHGDEMQVGDLLFFRIEGKMSHVGMYVGAGRFVHAPQSGRNVSVASLEAPFYKSALLRAGRIY